MVIPTLRLVFCITYLFTLTNYWLSAQCTPPMAETCDVAQVLCSLDELNGYACNNPGVIPSQCSPLCSQGGVGFNTSWWAFVAGGGTDTISLTVGGCTGTHGLQYGIWADCLCKEEVICRSNPCINPNSISKISVKMKPCQVYYFWVNGCAGDICDFTINTSVGISPHLGPLSFINNDSDKIIGPLCEGACNMIFFIEPQKNACNVTYSWTLDGDEVGKDSTAIKLDFPDEGDFIICVTAKTINPFSGMTCSQEGPQCAKIEVRKFKEKTNQIRSVCYEFLKNGAGTDSMCTYLMNGTYHCDYYDNNCCHIIESGRYNVLNIPDKPDVYYITCDNEAYIDALGRAHFPCKDHFEISLPKTTDPYRCDSAIRLTAINVEFLPRWRVQCLGGMVEISPNITILRPCSLGETYEFEYRWYNNNDPQKRTLSTDERLLVDAVKEDYCVEVNVKVELQTEFALCAKTFCETFNEDDLKPYGFPLKGTDFNCVNRIADYWIDTFISQKVIHFQWSVVNGTIISKKDTFGIKVKWSLNVGDTGTVCCWYETDCARSNVTCLKNVYSAISAGRDFKQKGIFGKLDAAAAPSGIWTKISGPGNAVFQNPKDPKTRVRIDVYGRYCFEWFVDEMNCISRDTVCVEFYKIKIADPDTPNKDLEDRKREHEYYFFDVLTPNPIPAGSSVQIQFTTKQAGHVHYTWHDLQGRMMAKNSFYSETGQQKREIITPFRPGFYILVIESNGIRELRKICVI